MDPTNRKHVSSNLNIDERQGLNVLIGLQRVGILSLKQCGKGAGIIFVNNEAYLKFATSSSVCHLRFQNYFTITMALYMKIYF